MKELNKLFNDIEVQLNNESLNYRRLEICKCSFEISKVCIISLSVGLSFISIFFSFKHNSSSNYRFNKT